MWKRAKAALFGLFTLLILFMLFGGEFGFLSAYRYTRYERILQEQLASEQARQDSLEKVLERLKNDPEYLERMAREKLSMVKDGEKIYRFEETEKEQ